MKEKENNSNSDRKKRALVMTLSYPSADPRPLRMIGFLQSSDYQVDLLSYPFNREPIEGINRHHVIPKPKYDLFSKVLRNLHELTPIISVLIPAKSLIEYLILSRYELTSFLETLKDEIYDLIVVQDLFLLPIAFSIKKNAKLLFDAREFYPSQNEENRFFRMFEKPEREWLCSQYLQQCDELITVSQGVKERYDREFGVNFSILRSIPKYHNIEPSELKINRFRMVHHGAAQRNRQLEKMIAVTRKLDSRFTLDMYLVGEAGYIEELKNQVTDTEKIKIKDPIEFDEIVPTINQYDIGLFYIEPTTFNLKYCLPNKLFEFIQARLMVAIGPSPDMAALIHKMGCGVISKDFSVESMINSLSKLTSDEVWEFKQKSHQAANELCYEKEVEKLNHLVDNKMNKHG